MSSKLSFVLAAAGLMTVHAKTRKPPMSKMVEKLVDVVAPVLLRRELPGQDSYDYTTEVVRAILQAMREPTEGMIEAITDEIGYCEFSGKSHSDTAAMVWMRAIGATLTEGACMTHIPLEDPRHG